MDLARRRLLTPEKLERLNHLMAADPRAWPDCKDDMALTRLLNRLPDAPLSSNFTALVRQAIELEERRADHAARPMSLRGWSRGWFARIGFVSCVALVAAGGWYRHQLSERADLAESVATISEVAAIPSVDILKDFETIQSFGKVPPAADMEADLHLLAALE